MGWNPFTNREQRTETDPRLADTPVSTVPEYAVPQHGSYASPSLMAGDAYTDEFGWGPGQKQRPPSTTDVPSAQRTNVGLLLTFRNPPAEPPENWYDKRDSDTRARESVVDLDADGREESKGITATDRRWAPNPRSIPPPESRRTQQMSPSTWSFVRPFDTGYARTFNGMHFSMADHRRNYEIYGMAPVTSKRNTYRQEPVPWDVDVIDMPNNNGEPVLPYARLVSPELPPSRRWRL